MVGDRGHSALLERRRGSLSRRAGLPTSTRGTCWVCWSRRFHGRTIAAAAACLLSPWVDERFVLALPLVVLVRGIGAGTLEGGISKRFRSEGMLFFALMAPYCSLRLIALATAQDQGSAAHLRGHLATVHHAGEVIDGLWSGLRAFWVFVMAAPVLLVSRGRLVQAGLLVLLVAATAAASVSIATDLSRATSTVVPAAVLGIILSLRTGSRLAWWPLAAALAFNLLAPARHVVEGWREAIPILPLHVGARPHQTPATARGPAAPHPRRRSLVNSGNRHARSPRSRRRSRSTPGCLPRTSARACCWMNLGGPRRRRHATTERSASRQGCPMRTPSAPLPYLRTASTRRRSKIFAWQSTLRQQARLREKQCERAARSVTSYYGCAVCRIVAGRVDRAWLSSG